MQNYKSAPLNTEQTNNKIHNWLICPTEDRFFSLGLNVFQAAQSPALIRRLEAC